MPILIFFILAFLFVYLELSLLIWVGTSLGVLGVILLLILSSIIGITMIRMRGWYTLINVQKQLAQGELPASSLIKSGVWILAGVLFFIPGFLSDLFAIFLLTPIASLGIEKLIRNKIHFFASGFAFRRQAGFGESQDQEIFEAEYEKQNDENKRLK